MPEDLYKGDEGMNRLSQLMPSSPDSGTPKVDFRASLENDERKKEAEKLAQEEAEENERKAEARKKLLQDKKKFGETVRNAANTSEDVNEPGKKSSKEKAISELEDAGFKVEYFEEKMDVELLEIKESMNNLASDRETDEKTEEILTELGVDAEVITEWVDKVEMQIKRNEELYRSFFFSDYSEESIEQYRQELDELWNVLLDDGTLQSIVDNGFEYDDNLELLQEAYFRKIFGDESWDELLKNKADIVNTEDSLNSPDDKVKILAESTVEKQRGGMRSKIHGRMGRVGKEREWLTLETELAEKYLQEHFGLVEKAATVDDSEMGWLTTSLGATLFKRETYVKSMVLNVDRKDWSKEKNDLFESTINLHDVAVELNKSDAPKDKSEILKSNLMSIDEDIKKVVQIKDKAGNLVVPRVVSVYDQVMSEMYGDDGLKAVGIDSLEVVEKVKERLKKEPTKLDLEDDGLELAMSIGRSLCGIMGIDSSYSYSRYIVGDPPERTKLPSGSKGSLMNEVLNVKIAWSQDAVMRNVIRESYSNVNIGVEPFVNKISGRPIDENVFYGGVMNNFPVGSEFKTWVGDVFDAKQTIKIEKQVLGSKDPIVNLGELFKVYGQLSPKDKKPYLRRRLSDVFSAYLDKHRKENKKDTDLVKLLVTWNEDKETGNVFSDEEFDEFLAFWDLPKKDENTENREAENTLNGRYGDEARKEFIKKGGASKYYERNPKKAFEAAKHENTWRNFFNALLGNTDE